PYTTLFRSISVTAYPAPMRLQSSRNGLSVTPAIGARISGGSIRWGPIIMTAPILPGAAGAGTTDGESGRAAPRDEMHGARLRAVVAVLLVEPDLVADAEVVEVGVHDAVAVEVDQTPLRRRDAPEIAVRMQHLDRSARRAFAGLDLAADDSNAVLELTARRVEGVPHRHVDVLVRLILVGIPACDDLRARHPDVDEHAIELAFALAPVRSLDRHAATDDLGHVALELEGALPRLRLD